MKGLGRAAGTQLYMGKKLKGGEPVWSQDQVCWEEAPIPMQSIISTLSFSPGGILVHVPTSTLLGLRRDLAVWTMTAACDFCIALSSKSLARPMGLNPPMMVLPTPQLKCFGHRTPQPSAATASKSPVAPQSARTWERS